MFLVIRMICFQMAKIFRMGPVQSCIREAVFLSENDNDRDQNLNKIKEHFVKKQTQKCELVVCIMDSNWNELRPTIKLNGTVNYGN